MNIRIFANFAILIVTFCLGWFGHKWYDKTPEPNTETRTVYVDRYLPNPEPRVNEPVVRYIYRTITQVDTIQVIVPKLGKETRIPSGSTLDPKRWVMTDSTSVDVRHDRVTWWYWSPRTQRFYEEVYAIPTKPHTFSLHVSYTGQDLRWHGVQATGRLTSGRRELEVGIGRPLWPTGEIGIFASVRYGLLYF